MENEKRSLEDINNEARTHIFTAIDDLKSAATIYPNDDDLDWEDGVRSIARQVKILNEAVYNIDFILSKAK